MGTSCSEQDLVAGKTYWLLWGVPLAVVLAGTGTTASVRAVLWTGAFVVMGSACVANAARCGRLHCFITGPLFLLAALASALVGLDVLPLGWSWIGVGALGGTLAAYALEWARGRYVRPSLAE